MAALRIQGSLVNNRVAQVPLPATPNYRLTVEDSFNMVSELFNVSGQ